jgi:hypothetical protein
MAGNLGRLVVVASAEGILAVLGLEGVDMDGAIGGLCGNELIQRVPGDALNVMAVLGNLSYEDTCIGSVWGALRVLAGWAYVPELALYILAMLSMLPMMK